MRKKNDVLSRMDQLFLNYTIVKIELYIANCSELVYQTIQTAKNIFVINRGTYCGNCDLNCVLCWIENLKLDPQKKQTHQKDSVYFTLPKSNI